MKNITLLITLLTTTAMHHQGCSSKSDQLGIEIQVSHYKVPCTGMGNQLCFLIREAGATDWQFLYETIAGFDYQWGFEYTLEVVKERANPALMDGADFHYRLNQVIAKTKISDTKAFEIVLKDEDLQSVSGNPRLGYKLFNEMEIVITDQSLAHQFEAQLENQNLAIGVFVHGPEAGQIQLIELKEN